MIPITVIDDFFENPSMVVDFANSLEYKKDEEGRWPGKRSLHLHEVDYNFFHKFCMKMFSLYVDMTDQSIKWSVSLCFQKIDNSYGEGWVHQDTDSIITSIVYLNENYNSKSGTSIMAKKVLMPVHSQAQKQLAILNQEDKNTKEFRELTNNQYEECVSLRNKYNRFIAFPSHYLHKAQNFDNVGERLTLIAFVEKLYIPQMPLQNMRKIII